MRKYGLLLVFLSFVVLSLHIISCRASGGDETNNNTYTYPPYPHGIDSDGDTWPDTIDCAPADLDYWQWLLLYPDTDGDNIPDSNLAVIRCVGLPNTYQGYTTTPPPPLDRCLNDPNNTCQTLRPYLEIDFDFPSSSYSWIVYGTCFVDPDPPDAFPEMGNGQGGSGTIVGDINPDAVASGYCDFAISLNPEFQNHCGDLVNWLPYQCNATLYSDVNGNPFNMEVFLSPTGYVTDEIELTWTMIDNQLGGGNFRVNLQTSDDGNVNIIANLPIDTDGDGLLNPSDNCIWVENPGQETNPANPIGANGQLAGNACQGIDNDNDGWLNGNDAYPNDASQH